MTIFKNQSVIRWAKLKKFVDSQPDQAFTIRKDGDEYIVHPSNNSQKAIKI